LKKIWANGGPVGCPTLDKAVDYYEKRHWQQEITLYLLWAHNRLHDLTASILGWGGLSLPNPPDQTGVVSASAKSRP
jgi:hypothetical protein